MKKLFRSPIVGAQIAQMEAEPPGRSDEEVVRLFVDHIGLKIDRWPDRDNREHPDIDALAGDLAIEHTSVDSYENQRRDGVRFRDVLGSLKDEIGPSLPYRLWILIPHDAVSKGDHWDATAARMRRWIVEDSPALADGGHLVADPEIGFEFWVQKDSTSRPGLFFWRNPPSDRRWLDASLLKEQLESKIAKLAPYKRKGFRTTLLIETNDIAMINESTVLGAIERAYRGVPSGVDQVWWVGTSLPEEVFFEDLTEFIEDPGP